VENLIRKKLSVIWHDAVGGLQPDFWILWSGILVNRIGALAFPFLSFFLVGPALGGWVLQTLGGRVLRSACGVIGCLVGIAFWTFFDRIPFAENEEKGTAATVS
jgi:hypothetical protein